MSSDAVASPARRTRYGPLALAFALAAIAAWGIWPSRLGGATTVLAVEGNSMLPTYRNGDLVVARSDGGYETGDVVVIRVAIGDAGRHALVVHRIIDVRSDGSVVTKGDNRATADGFPTTVDDIVGRARWRLPRGALLLHLLSSWPVLALITGTLVAVSLWPTGTSRTAREPRGERGTV
jgi:signal peptidase I